MGLKRGSQSFAVYPRDTDIFGEMVRVRSGFQTLSSVMCRIFIQSNLNSKIYQTPEIERQQFLSASLRYRFSEDQDVFNIQIISVQPKDGWRFGRMLLIQVAKVQESFPYLYKQTKVQYMRHKCLNILRLESGQQTNSYATAKAF